MRKRSSRLLTLVAAATVMAACCPAAASPQAVPEETRVRKIELSGNISFSDRTLKSLMKTREPSLLRPLRKSIYRPDFLGADIVSIKAFYHKNGFLRVEVPDPVVRRDPVTNRVDIWIHIKEGERVEVGEVSFSGIESLPKQEVIDATHLRKGRPYDPSQLRADAQRILSLYADAGKVLAMVNHKVTLKGDRAYIHFDIAEGPRMSVGRITISGNATTKDKVIRRELAVHPGEIYSQRKIVDSEQRIYNTGLFNNVRFSLTNVDSASDLVDLDLRVSEKKSGWVDGGLGYSSGELLKLSTEWGNRNLGGSARRISLRGEVFVPVGKLLELHSLTVQQDRLGVSFVEPWLAGTRTSLILTAFHESRLEPREQAFRETERGFKTSLRRRFATFAEGEISYNNPWVRSTRVETKNYVTHSLTATGRRDTREDPLDPRKGSFQELSAKYAGGVFGGDFDFWKVTFGSSWYKSFDGARGVVAGRIVLGLAEPFGFRDGLGPEEKLSRVPFADKFRTGGSTTIRGYSEEQLQIVGPSGPLGALAMLVGNLELRHLLFGRVGGVVFLDAGNAWASGGEIVSKGFGLRVDPDLPSARQVRYTCGLGLRVMTPVGPFRVDYAVRLKMVPGDSGKRARLHLSLGQAF